MYLLTGQEPKKQHPGKEYIRSFHPTPTFKNPAKKLLTWVNRPVISPNFTIHVFNF
jgi:hypothetical protein